MPLPDLQTYVRPHVISIFDLLTPELVVLCPCTVDHSWQFASESVLSFTKYRVHKFGNRRTNGQPENVIPLSASLIRWRHNGTTRVSLVVIFIT